MSINYADNVLLRIVWFGSAVPSATRFSFVTQGYEHQTVLFNEVFSDFVDAVRSFGIDAVNMVVPLPSRPSALAPADFIKLCVLARTNATLQIPKTIESNSTVVPADRGSLMLGLSPAYTF